jgi:hypothetical protein
MISTTIRTSDRYVMRYGVFYCPHLFWVVAKNEFVHAVHFVWSTSILCRRTEYKVHGLPGVSFRHSPSVVASLYLSILFLADWQFLPGCYRNFVSGVLLQSDLAAGKTSRSLLENAEYVCQIVCRRYRITRKAEHLRISRSEKQVAKCLVAFIILIFLWTY